MNEIEGAQGAYARIQSKKTLKEILEVASSFEESARNFYRDLTPKVSKNVRWVVEELAKEYEGRLKVVKINTQDNPDVPGQLGIKSIPTLIVFKGTQVADHRVGAVGRDSLRQMIDGVLNPKPSLFGRLFGGKGDKAEA